MGGVQICTTFERMVTILGNTDWFKDFRGKVRGNLESAVQHAGRAIAICIEGGPVTQVENYFMDDICDSVRVFGYPKAMDTALDIRRYSFAEFREIWQPSVDPVE